jgi:hypothetical protein
MRLDGTKWIATGDSHTVEVTYFGLLGQWVVEKYELWLDDHWNGRTDKPRWSLRSLTIVTSVHGAPDLELDFPSLRT